MTESFHQHMPDKGEIHPLTVNSNLIPMNKAIGFIVVSVIAGIAVGFVLSQFTKVPSTKTASKTTETTTEKTVVGIKDKGTFKDSAEGVLKEGGVEGEGNFHLERPGGESQNVYLTSATVDLSTYIGKKVKVWGQTINSQKVGWLMDVGLVESQ